MSSARTSLLVFFPSTSLIGSPFHPYREEAIREILHELLRKAPSIIDGYEIAESDGSWYDGRQWHSDANWVIRTYMSVAFAQGLANHRSTEAQYVARLAHMSCVQMGHAEFFAIAHNNRVITGNREGLRIGHDRQVIQYAQILNESECTRLIMDGCTYTIELTGLTAKGDLASGKTVGEIESQLRGQNAPAPDPGKYWRVEGTWIQGQKPRKSEYDAIDLDNPVKAAIDTVNATESGWQGARLLWEDDVQIVELVLRREYDDVQKDSTLHLAIREVSKPCRQRG